MIVALLDIAVIDAKSIAIRWKPTFIATIVQIVRSYTTLPYLLFCTKTAVKES